MNRWWVVCLVLVLASGLAEAAPEAYRVVVTPLYGNPANTLTCHYIGNDSAATAAYRWYDGADGVWYNGVATYTATEAGYEYNCSVKLTHGSTSGWYNSTNAAQISETCFNPFPFYYRNDEQNYNITDLYEAGLSYYVVGDYHKRVMENRSYLFVGSLWGGVASIPACDNTLYLLTGAGTFTLAVNTTDQDWATRNSRTTTSVDYQYSVYDTEGVVPKGAVVRSKVGLKCTATESSQFVLQGKTINSTWTNLSTRSQIGTTEVRFIDNATTTEDYYAFRVGHRSTAGTDTAWLYVYDVDIINVSCGAVAGAAVDSVWDTSTFDNFTADGFLYNWSFKEEMTGGDFDFSDAGVKDDSFYRTSCSVGTTAVNITDMASGSSVLVGNTEDLRHTETYVGYDAGDTMYRRYSPVCSDEGFYEKYSISSDAGTYAVTAFTFTINDETDSGKWEDGWLTFEKVVVGLGGQDILAERWAADGTVLAYLVANEEYTIVLTASDCSERELGYFTANPADTTRTITVSETDYNTSSFWRYGSYVSWYAWWENSTNRVRVVYDDTLNATNLFEWYVYYLSNDSQAYYANTTSSAYEGSYTGLPNRTYYVMACLNHASDNVTRCWNEGGLRRVTSRAFLSRFDYEGEIVGLTYPTLTLLVALAVIVLTGLSVGPGSVGVGAVLVWGEAVVFSIIGWLPFFGEGYGGISPTNGMFIMATVGVVALATTYFMSRRGGY